jgi:MoaA/NifB/PqqE/SkfB family radical SAM enzyme
VIITETTGITKIETLYLQLLYRCQFRCAHCFHGDRLAWRDAYSLEQATALIELMQRDYETGAVNLLGGEPFLYTHLGALLAHAKHELGMRTEICTNGYRITRKLSEFGRDIDFLRISLEGLEQANDAIRHPGSYQQAMAALAQAKRLDISTGATMTVTASNIDDVVPLALRLQELGVRELKLHHLRPVGFAADHPELQVADSAAYRKMRNQISGCPLEIAVIADEQLGAEYELEVLPRYGHTARRIEADPRGYLTMSCNAVGTDAHAFYYDKRHDRIEQQVGGHNEILLQIPPVVYAHA